MTKTINNESNPKGTPLPFSRVNYSTSVNYDKQTMTIREIRKHYECMKLLLESNDYPEGQGFALYKEFERWQNIYQTVKERCFEKSGFINEDEIIDKYTINKINGYFE